MGFCSKGNREGEHHREGQHHQQVPSKIGIVSG